MLKYTHVRIHSYTPRTAAKNFLHSLSSSIPLDICINTWLSCKGSTHCGHRRRGQLGPSSPDRSSHSPFLRLQAQVGFDCRETCLSLLGQSCLMGDSPWLFLYLCCCSFVKSYLTLCDPMNGSTPAFTALQLSHGVCSNSSPPAPVKGGVLAGKDVKNLNFQRTAGP